MSATTASPPPAGAISPTLALQLRLSHLQSLIGHAPAPAPPSTTTSTNTPPQDPSSPPDPTQPLLLRALAAKALLESSASTHSSLRKFLRDFDANRRLLDGAFRYDARSTPPDVGRAEAAAGAGTGGAARFFSLTLDPLGDEGQDRRSGNGSGSGSREAVLTTQEQILLVVEAERDMRTLERMLLECEALDRRGVAGAGKMAEYEQLQPLLEECLQRHKTELAPVQNEIEEALLRLLERYQIHVDSLSRLFISWDEALREMEDKLTALEKAKRRRGE